MNRIGSARMRGHLRCPDLPFRVRMRTALKWRWATSHVSSLLYCLKNVFRNVCKLRESGPCESQRTTTTLNKTPVWMGLPFSKRWRWQKPTWPRRYSRTSAITYSCYTAPLSAIVQDKARLYHTHLSLTMLNYPTRRCFRRKVKPALFVDFHFFRPGLCERWSPCRSQTRASLRKIHHAVVP